jgi:hypothetical protein
MGEKGDKTNNTYGGMNIYLTGRMEDTWRKDRTGGRNVNIQRNLCNGGK